MTTQLSQIKWIRVFLTALVVLLLSFVTVFIVVTTYAFFLAFQVRGAPDVGMINAFADQYAPWLGLISLGLFTFLGARHAARRAETAAQPNGIAVGVLAGLINFIIDGLGSFSLVSLLTVILAIGAGWLGGRSVQK
jgi:hypothetical protein